MGLLDKFIDLGARLGSAGDEDWVRRQQEARDQARSDRYARDLGLLNEQMYGGVRTAGGIMPSTETTDAMGRTVLTGGEHVPGYNAQQGLMNTMTQPQYNARVEQLGADAFGESFATKMAQQRLMNQGAMNRSMTMTPAQQQQMALAENTMVEAFQTKFNKDTQAYQGSIRGANAMDNLFPEDDYNVTGPAQLSGLMKFMKAANDGGAFMSDDMQNTARASGFTGMARDLYAWVTTDGFKDQGFLRDMHKIMRTQAITDSQRITEQAQSLRRGVPGLTDQHMQQITRGAGMGYVKPTKTTSEKSERYTRIE